MNISHRYSPLTFHCYGCGDRIKGANIYTIDMWMNHKTGHGALEIILCQVCSSEIMECILQNCRDTEQRSE